MVKLCDVIIIASMF